MHKNRRLKSWSIALESGTGIWYIIIRKGDTDVQVRKALSAKGSRVGAADRNTLADSKPVRAPAAGQSAVLYDGDRLLGGGFIVHR